MYGEPKSNPVLIQKRSEIKLKKQTVFFQLKVRSQIKIKTKSEQKLLLI